MNTTRASLVHIETSVERVSLRHLRLVFVLDFDVCQVSINIAILAATPIWLLIGPSTDLSLDTIRSLILSNPRRRVKRCTIPIVFEFFFVILVAIGFFFALLKHNLRV
jgi:hypothetical protein